jgi:polysaccharide chain length determinant protein (PEP-CTERM system associated)
MFQREWTSEDYIAMLRRRWLLIVILALVGAGAAYGVSTFLPNMYMSQSLVLIQKPTVPTEFVKPVTNSDISQRLTAMQQELLSPARLEPLIHQFGLYQQDTSKGVPVEISVANLIKAIDIAPVRASDDLGTPFVSGFYVRVTMENPQSAQEVCGAVASMFVQESSHRRQEQSERTTQFLAQQIADAKGKLDAEDARLAAFQTRHLGSLPDEEQINLNLLGGLTAELDATTQALVRAQQDKSLAESMLSQQIAARQASRTGQNTDTFGEQLTTLQTHLAELQAQYTNDYPDVVKTKIQIEALKKKMADAEDQNKTATASVSANPSFEPLQFTQLRAQIRVDEQTIVQKTKQQEQIQQQIKSYQERVQSSPGVTQEYKELTRDHQSALDFYNNLLTKRADSVMASNLEARQEGEQFQILTPANRPNIPSAPNRQLFGLGGAGGGLALGIGLALLLEMRDTTVKTEREVEMLLQYPVLAVMPALKPLSRSQSSQIFKQSRLSSGLKGA